MEKQWKINWKINWKSNAKSMENQWKINGKSMEKQWKINGKAMENQWILTRAAVAATWKKKKTATIFWRMHQRSARKKKSISSGSNYLRRAGVAATRKKKKERGAAISCRVAVERRPGRARCWRRLLLRCSDPESSKRILAWSGHVRTGRLWHRNCHCVHGQIMRGNPSYCFGPHH